ncbi:MAG TPA: radical SAM protein [Phycisphaerae bacterium]|nr:radical SAM protein [Phycisphaerae bacterium]
MGEAPALRLVFWETTAGCNLACIHCRRLDVSCEPTETDLTTDQARRMIADLADFARPILVFSGGEPLMRPDLYDLADWARTHGLRTALASNGTLIDAEAARRVREAGFARVSISLDGVDAATHDRFRQLAGSFDRALAGLKHVQQAGVSAQINCTIARHNAGQIDALLRLAESLGVDAVHYFLLVPVGCGEQIAEEQMLPADQVEALLVQLAKLESKSSVPIKATCAPHYYRIVRQLGGRAQGGRGAHQANGSRPASTNQQPLHSMTRGCLAGRAVCFVSHTGQVYPCGYLPVSAGDVTRQRFADIWRNSAVFARLRNTDLLQGRCSVCEFRHICGGCRARAFYQHGDYLAEEPYCSYVPGRMTSRHHPPSTSDGSGG